MRALAVVLFVTVSGCGASAMRMHAIAAHSYHELVADAGDTIVAAERQALAACPHDDGPDRTLCLDHAEHVFVTAGAARDLMIPLADAYRDQVLASCGADAAGNIPEACPDAGPDVMSRLVTLGATLAADAATLTAAIAALTGGH